jgi:hypothetical protein
MRFLGLVSVLCLLVLVGCGGASNQSVGVGKYTMVITKDLQDQIDRTNKQVDAIKAKAAGGDAKAQEVLKVFGDVPVDLVTLTKSQKLEINTNGTFTMTFVDSKKVRHEFKGVYTVDGIKMTLTPTQIDSNSALTPENSKPLVVSYDEKAKTITCESGSGPKLVFERD